MAADTPRDGEDPRRTPKEAIVKAIILISGSATSGTILFEPPGVMPMLLPDAARPPGFVPNPGVNFWSAPPSAAPYAACATAYAAQPFVLANWRFLSGGQVASLVSLQAQLNLAKAWNPVAVVVHYVGHGGFANNVTYWSCRGTIPRGVTWVQPNGQPAQAVFQVPNDGVEIFQIDLALVKQAMLQTFPGIPLTLITDACENQRALALGGGNFRVIVCDKVESRWMLLMTFPRLVNEGLFSTFWAPVVGPTCFTPDDAPINGRPAALAAVNAAMAPVPAPAPGGPQIAACNPAP